MFSYEHGILIYWNNNKICTLGREEEYRARAIYSAFVTAKRAQTSQHRILRPKSLVRTRFH